MKIAIVDDRKDDLRAARESVNKYFSSVHPELMDDLSIVAFQSGEELLATFEPGLFDLLILAVYLGGMTGIEAAEDLRLKDGRVPIIFLTVSREHTLDGYRVYASGYILKPVEKHLMDFFRAMDHVLEQLMECEQCIVLPTGGQAVSLPLRKIVYVDVDSDIRMVMVHLVGSVVECSLPYRQMQELLKMDERFLECYHRIILNMDYVRRMDKEDFILKDGRKIPISKRRMKEAKLVYMRYMANR